MKSTILAVPFPRVLRATGVAVFLPTAFLLTGCDGDGIVQVLHEVQEAPPVSPSATELIMSAAMSPEVQIDSSTIIVSASGNHESLSFVDMDGNTHYYEATFNLAGDVALLTAELNDQLLGTVEPLWDNGVFAGSLITDADGQWALGDQSAQLVTWGNGGWGDGGGGGGEPPCDDDGPMPMSGPVEPGEPCDDPEIQSAALGSASGGGTLVRRGNAIYSDGRLLVADGRIMVAADQGAFLLADQGAFLLLDESGCPRALFRWVGAGLGWAGAFTGSAYATIKSAGLLAKGGWTITAGATVLWIDESISVGQKCFRDQEV